MKPSNQWLDGSLKIYCEHGALSSDLREMQRQGVVELLHFPYDPDSRTPKIPTLAMPSEAQIRDLNMPISDLPGTLGDYSGTWLHPEIVRILGSHHRRDALHIDSAFKSGCAAFVTCDSDILDQRSALESLTGMRFFHPESDRDELRRFATAQGAA